MPGHRRNLSDASIGSFQMVDGFESDGEGENIINRPIGNHEVKVGDECIITIKSTNLRNHLTDTGRIILVDTHRMFRDEAIYLFLRIMMHNNKKTGVAVIGADLYEDQLKDTSINVNGFDFSARLKDALANKELLKQELVYIPILWKMFSDKSIVYFLAIIHGLNKISTNAPRVFLLRPCSSTTVTQAAKSCYNGLIRPAIVGLAGLENSGENAIVEHQVQCDGGDEGFYWDQSWYYMCCFLIHTYNNENIAELLDRFEQNKDLNNLWSQWNPRAYYTKVFNMIHNSIEEPKENEETA